MKAPDCHDLLGCRVCGLVQEAAHASCASCGAALHPRAGGNLQRCASLWLTALILYVPANRLPIMSTTQLGGTTYATITGGVALLWEHHSYLIAGIIFIASVLVPLAKFAAIAALALCQRYRGWLSPAAATTVYRLTEFVGRWSMVDVFVVGFLAALIQMGNLMSIVPGPAALAFGGMVLFTMLAAHSLDPRAFWTTTEDLGEAE
ncbi:MAG: paraquat-inducible protein A [Pseudomonadales bacterium]|nr:paraquat-inducible protein A [Pseudomonadales bacterium]